MAQANWGLPLFTVVVVDIVVFVMELELTTTGILFAIISLGTLCHLPVVDEFTQLAVAVAVELPVNAAVAADVNDAEEVIVVVVAFEGDPPGGAGAIRMGFGLFDDPVVVDIAFDEV